jgi:hypothetical protein
MSDEDADEEAFREMAAFEAQFPLEAFAGVAEALRVAPEPEALSTLRLWLLPEFYFFFVTCPGGEPSRDERIGQLEKLRDAATALLKYARITGGLTRTLREAAAGTTRDDQFKATVQRLAGEADEKIQRLRSSRGRAGRPRKDAFRQLAADLVRVYEKMIGEEAREPQWKGGSRYGGDFYEFLVAVERCLRTSLPEVRDELPVSSGAIGDGLRRHWASIREMAGEKSLPSKTQ